MGINQDDLQFCNSALKVFKMSEVDTSDKKLGRIENNQKQSNEYISNMVAELHQQNLELKENFKKLEKQNQVVSKRFWWTFGISTFISIVAIIVAILKWGREYAKSWSNWKENTR